MKKELQTKFSTRQYMLARDFEIYYYNSYYLSNVECHSHSYYEFYFFLEGQVSIEIDGTVYPLKYGDVILIPPGVRHRAQIHSQDTPYRRFVFWVSKEYCAQLLALSKDYVYLMQCAAVKRNYIFHNDIITFNTIQSKVFQLIEEIHADKFGREAKISLCVNDLILHLNRTAYEKEHLKVSGGEKSLYRSLVDYIEENLEKSLTLESLSEQFYVSKYHIAHIFKENAGLSIHQYITKKRLKACGEAIVGNGIIREVYLLYGFGDYSSFYRAFRKEYGISPKEYLETRRTVIKNREEPKKQQP